MKEECKGKRIYKVDITSMDERSFHRRGYGASPGLTFKPMNETKQFGSIPQVRELRNSCAKIMVSYEYY